MGHGLILLQVLLVALGPPLGVLGSERRLRTPPPHFLYQEKAECRFANGTAGEVRYLERFIDGRQEFLRFDSRRGWFEAVTELGERQARDFNSQKDWMDYERSVVDRFCRLNYDVFAKGLILSRTAEPLVKISPTKGDPLAHHTLLICTAAGYYPPGIDIKWLKNGQEQTQGVGYDDEIQNADWTYQYQAMLETVPQRGDVYACQVEHKSVKEPISVQWEPRTSDSAKSKVWTGAVGAVLGLVFVAVGLYLYLKSRKGEGLEGGCSKEGGLGGVSRGRIPIETASGAGCKEGEGGALCLGGARAPKPSTPCKQKASACAAPLLRLPPTQDALPFSSLGNPAAPLGLEEA
ncbi:H-2 class II histocompatibility antigen, E-S beta chain-like [Heteronotia binoei]|uniref:H-2 class II histocompatibility antigen, E-S beta chain-like n=1 Tax=Heteronotia binoei TaxID=13085 RepID=UPI0029305FF3|nr:H-2 class II histocompatibility antigen, E-S beta chain-like [Heteronotia binoei]